MREAAGRRRRTAGLALTLVSGVSWAVLAARKRREKGQGAEPDFLGKAGLLLG